MTNHEFLAVLEEACRATRIPVGTIRSDQEAQQVIEWADLSLQLTYAAGEIELGCDLTELKRDALLLRYEANLYLAHKKHSDIVSICTTVATQLRKVCEDVCPDLSIYLDSRIMLGTY